MSENGPSMTVKSTLHLTAERHDELAVWQRDAARKLGRARVTRQEVLATLVARLLADEELAGQILASL